MLCIYQIDSELVRKKKKLTELLGDLPVIYRDRAFRYKFEADAYNFVLGRLLLKKGLDNIGGGTKLEDINYQEDGKPLLKGVFFNISHSDKLVVCAISTEGQIGIDVEKEKPVDLENFKAWFTEKEFSDIINSSNPDKKFFWYWTRKESIIKALGLKLSELHRIELDSTQDYFIYENKKWYLKDLDFGKGYAGALCSEVVINDLKMMLV